MLGTTEIIIIIVGIILLFGAKRIPGLIHGIIKGVRDFRKEANEPDNTNSEDENNNLKK